MNTDQQTLKPEETFNQLLEQLTARGEHFELVQISLEGRQYPVYKNAPETLKALTDAGRTHGDKTFLVYEGERLSFAEFYQQVDMAAAQMHHAWGIKPQDRVAIAMRNYPEWMAAFCAIVRIGAVPVPINSWGSAEEIRYVIEDAGVRALVADQARYDFFGDDKSMSIPMVVARPDRSNRAPEWHQWVQEAASLSLPDYKCAADDMALMFYTSGTTGRPKGVRSTHRQVCQAIFNFECVGMAMGMTNGDIMAEVMKDGDDYAALLSVPLFHVSGCYAVFLLCLRSGRRTVMTYKWDAPKVARYIEEERIGILSVAPSMLVELFQSEEFKRANTTHLFAIGGGGSAYPNGLLELIEEKAKNRMPGCGYGMTESNASATSMNGHLFRARPKASGLTSPIMRIDIRDEHGKSVGVGNTGEIWLYGITIASGYWEKPESTAESFVDGWYRTGDVGRLDDAGYLFIVDRIKDTIIRGGENISTLEIESAIQKHPKVVETAVFSLPSDTFGEMVAAEVVLKNPTDLSQDEIQTHVASQLARFKVPEQVFFRTEPLPRNPTGKVLKKDLQKLRGDTP